MARRMVSIWFQYLLTDWFALPQPTLRQQPFVLKTPDRGRLVVSARNAVARAQGLYLGMALADARALIPGLQVADLPPKLTDRLLNKLAHWAIRFTPVVAVDPPDGLLLDVTGCAHLWGGEAPYLAAILEKLAARGYTVRAALADTAGAAWAVARHAPHPGVVPTGFPLEALLPLPPEALRPEPDVAARLHKLGLRQLRQVIALPRQALRRRFGPHLLLQLDKALGQATEVLNPVQPIVPYHERLPCLEPILTAGGIAFALQQLLERLCARLQKEQQGLRSAILKAYRVDGQIEQLTIGTNRPTHHAAHLFKLFDLKLATIAPGMGIELFTLDAPQVEAHTPAQEKLWTENGSLLDVRLAELLDRITGKTGPNTVHRYIPDEHHWPERSYKTATPWHEVPTTPWRTNQPRPLYLLPTPIPIDVTAPIPDYPPMLFRYQQKIYKIIRADGPERIEQVWWLQQGPHRDYYRVEDDTGRRYWIFRLGHYHQQHYQWFMHGFFA